MRFFFDESGSFAPATGWSVVCSLTLPHKEVGPARRKITYLTRDWPRVENGELKGGSLTAKHLLPLIEVLFAREALLHAVAIDMSFENEEGLKSHKRGQCEGMTMHLTAEHDLNLVDEVWRLRRTLESMSMQLYVQSILMTTLVATVTEQAAMYFSQRRPAELADFEWIVDAKDPLRITTQEKWWCETIAPWLESRGRREPIQLGKGAEFNYSFFEKSYMKETLAWHPDKSREFARGYDIKKLVSSQIRFVDSRSEILIQAVDILASFLRRILTEQVRGFTVAHALGKIQIKQRASNGGCQSMQLMTLSRETQIEQLQFGKLMRLMSLSGRSMLRPAKSLSRDKMSTFVRE